jgi:hypothetical protein
MSTPSPGRPFSNTDEVARREHFIPRAVISDEVMKAWTRLPVELQQRVWTGLQKLCLREIQRPPPSTAESVRMVKALKAFRSRSVRQKEDLDSLKKSNDLAACEPPLVAEFLLNLFARSNRDEFEVGEIRERFTRNSVQRGPSRAAWLYWSDVLGYLLRYAFKAAPLIAMIKRLFGSLM